MHSVHQKRPANFGMGARSFPDGALLMVESWCSCLLMIPIYALLVAVNTPDDLFAMGLIQDPAIILLVFFVVASWGKDAEKLKVTKYGSAVLVKVIAFLISFVAYWFSGNEILAECVGEDWSTKSFTRLSGFL